MRARIFAIFPISFDRALDTAERVDMPGATIIEPSCFAGFLAASQKDAVYFALRFGAKQWPAEDPDVFLMIAPGSQEVEDWLAQNPNSGELIEMVAVEFQSASDLYRFEKALWP